MQLKKLGHIILVLLLLISTAGVSINKHYSGGELFSTAIFVKAEPCCEIPCGCCDESSELIKVEADYLASAHELFEIAQFDLLFAYVAVPAIIETAASLNIFLVEDSPLPLPDLCVMNQVFRL
ncbi:MAG: hypothetical protein N4A59_04290 [Marinifilum sp.]|jgi:hypothetical protein|nr:hypothetical protein [Marinifilum sp.]